MAGEKGRSWPKKVPVLFFPPQNAHGLPWDLNKTSIVKIKANKFQYEVGTGLAHFLVEFKIFILTSIRVSLKPFLFAIASRLSLGKPSFLNNVCRSLFCGGKAASSLSWPFMSV